MTCSQADFIPQEVRKWPRQRVLGWLRQYGEVREWPIQRGYVATQFRAPSGLATTFLLTEEGKLSIFVGDHSIRAICR